MNININLRANLIPTTALNQGLNCDQNPRKPRRSRSSRNRSRSKSGQRQIVYEASSAISACEVQEARNSRSSRSNRNKCTERRKSSDRKSRSSNQKPGSVYSKCPSKQEKINYFEKPEVEITCAKTPSNQEKINYFEKSQNTEIDRSCSQKRNIVKINSFVSMEKLEVVQGKPTRNSGNKQNSKKTSRAKKLTIADIPHFEQYLKICDNIKIKQCVSGDVIYKMKINKEKQQNMYKSQNAPQPAYHCLPYGPQGMNRPQYYPLPPQYQPPHMYQQPCPPGYQTYHCLPTQNPGFHGYKDTMNANTKED